jgi:hypothetical protein
MLGQACPYRAEQHYIVHPELERWLQRNVSEKSLRDSLFIYKHLWYGTYVIAQWVSKGSSFIDLRNLGGSLRNFNREMAQNFLQQVNHPMSGKAMGKCMAQHESDILRNQQESNDENVDWNNWRRNPTQRVLVSMSH